MVLILCVCFALSRRLCIVTGANRGVGYEAVKQLACTNEWDIIMACRSLENGNAALNSLQKGRENCKVEILDLANLDSVKSFSKIIGGRSIDVLALNAGCQHSTSGFGGRERDLKPVRTKQGFEDTVGTNHIGHFLLLSLLLENVNKSNGRIVFVGSGVHNPDEGGGNVGSKGEIYITYYIHYALKLTSKLLLKSYSW